MIRFSSFLFIVFVLSAGNSMAQTKKMTLEEKIGQLNLPEIVP